MKGGIIMTMITPTKFPGVGSPFSIFPKNSKVANIVNEILPPKGERLTKAKEVLKPVLAEFVHSAKSKPESERNIFDYVMLIIDKLNTNKSKELAYAVREV